MKKFPILFLLYLVCFNTLIYGQTGIITTIAGNGILGYSGDGGPATNASIYNPTGITGDLIGNIYFVDADNYIVRKIDLFGIVTTYAGIPGFCGGFYYGSGCLATTTPLHFPIDIISDNNNNLYLNNIDGYVFKINQQDTISVYGPNNYIDLFALDSILALSGIYDTVLPGEPSFPVMTYISIDTNKNIFILIFTII
jgi:hypothetical protein